MTEQADYDETMKALQRMVSYVHAEARRLGVMDVAVLLEHAAEAVVEFSPTAAPDAGRAEVDGAERALRGH